MSEITDPEVKVMETIVGTLAPLDTDTAQRVLRAVAERFGVTLTPLGER